MQTYFDLLPLELLGCLVPFNHVRTFLQVFETPERQFEVFVAYVQHAYPYYYKIYIYDHPTQGRFQDIMMMLFNHYTVGDEEYEPINDIEETIDEVLRNFYDGGRYEPFEWIYPIILTEKFPLVLRYLMQHPEIASDYRVRL